MTPPPDMPPPAIALLTDFGLGDWYVAAMKGRILARLPGARLIDVSHDVPPGRVESGAFLLRCVRDAMPEGTIFLCVVDPGVGTARRAICGRLARFGYAGPDNGLATPLLETAGDDFDLHEIESPQWREPRVSATFQGRDLFAPAAACFAAGLPPAMAGRAVRDPVRLPPDQPEAGAGGLIARVMLVDRFGNLITNITESAWAARFTPGRFTIHAAALRIRALATAFGHVGPGEALAYWGSAGTLEVAVNRGSAAAATGLRPGDALRIEWKA